MRERMRFIVSASSALIFFSSAGIVHASIAGAAGNVEFWRPLGGSPRPGVLFIVTHDSWGPPGSGRSTARSQSGGRVGAEWWVLADGTIIHSDHERVTGHCGQYAAPGVGQDCNRRSVGIEFEGFGQHTAQQVRSGLALIRFLQERYCIQSGDIAAHRKAGNGIEGVRMEQAGRGLGYKPNCTGIVTGAALPEDLIRQALQGGPPPQLSQQFGNLLGQQPQSYGQPSPYSYGGGYGPAPAGSQYILGDPGGSNAPPGSPTSYTPVSGAPVQSSPSASTILQQLAYPSPMEGEDDSASRESEKTAQRLKLNETITVFALGATTSAELSLREVVQDTVIVTPLHQAPTTFTPPPPEHSNNIGSDFRFGQIIEGLRAIIEGLMRLLGR